MAISKLSPLHWPEHDCKLYINFSKFQTNTKKNIQISDDQQTSLTAYVKQCFNAQTLMLNMSANQNKVINGLTLDFSNFSFLRALFNSISIACPNMTSLDLSNNGMKHLKAANFLQQHAQSLVNLNLENNNISDHKVLDNLTDINWRELILRGNPIASQDQQQYISEIRRRFPSLRYLDGNQLKPVISFAIPNHALHCELPPAQPSYFATSNYSTLAKDFLQRFFAVYDSEPKLGRQSLVTLYTPQSHFSATIPAISKFFKDRSNSKHRMKHTAMEDLSHYQPQSRNLLRVPHLPERMSLLRTGGVKIVSALLDFPTTKHNLASFQVDAFESGVFVAGQRALSIVVHGSFWEVECSMNRNFDRTFLVVSSPTNAGFNVTIINEQLHIRPYTGKDATATFVAPTVPASATLVPTVTPILTSSSSPLFASREDTAIAAVGAVRDDKATQTAKFMSTTGLNKAWAEKCLEKNNWNQGNALQMFLDLQKQGKFPAVAFETDTTK
eukprot:TRINITY_DN21757_c0_g1_i1.p1 TRINITY_DN21757_c0_g1~~TRINITY_DN21757_c0_g1_i1.p1  ORF type:complete len:507 (-),score=73.95 TRINITY_DN21757_c0_g1_i1:26-1525(-)